MTQTARPLLATKPPTRSLPNSPITGAVSVAPSTSLTAAPVVDEAILANEYTFTANGRRFG